MEREQIIKALECFHLRILKSKLAEQVTEQEVMAIIDALALIKELTEENERLKDLATTKEVEKEIVRKQTKADNVREIFKEIYSSLDYIEEQMEPEEIPECFFSVREDIEALKIKFEREGKI